MSKQEQSVNNLLYFEAPSMKELYECMKSWQDENRRFFLQLNIQQDSGKFCCVALLDPGLIMRDIVKTKYEEAMTRFQRKALRIIVNEGKIGADIEFVDGVIPAEKIQTIQSRLKECMTAREIKAVFTEEL